MYGKGNFHGTVQDYSLSSHGILYTVQAWTPHTKGDIDKL